MYHAIFFTNILRILSERDMSKYELANRAGISSSFLSSLTLGKANPSLKIMESIALALGVPLSVLLEHTDLDEDSLSLFTESFSDIPPGYKRVSVILPDYRAYQVEKWANETKIKLQKIHYTKVN